MTIFHSEELAQEIASDSQRWSDVGFIQLLPHERLPEVMSAITTMDAEVTFRFMSIDLNYNKADRVGDEAGRYLPSSSACNPAGPCAGLFERQLAGGLPTLVVC